MIGLEDYCFCVILSGAGRLGTNSFMAASGAEDSRKWKWLMPGVNILVTLW